jgi:hypothetical protein
MSGWLDKIKKQLTPERSEKAADSIEKNLTKERVDSALNRVPGGSRMADKTPSDLNTKVGDAVRGLGDKQEPRT